MVQDNGKFRISLAIAEYLKFSPFAVTSKKLLLALIYLQDIEEEAWPKAWLSEAGDSDQFYDEPLRQHFCHVAHLHSLGFASNSKSSRFLTKPVADLLQFSGFFDELTLIPGKNGYLSWKFGLLPAALMTNMDSYALMESKDIAHCSGDLDVALLTQITLRYKMRFPVFSLLTVDPKTCWAIEPKTPPILDQRPFKTKLRRSLQKWATLKNCRLVAELGQDGTAPGITSVNIRLSHADTEWSNRQLSKYHPRSIIIDVMP